MTAIRQGTDERFAAKVDKSGDCWEWTGHREPNGYGRFYYNGRMTWAHRVSWQLFRGPIPTGLDVCHHCDNRGCVRPSHLFVGTRADNMADANRKGRIPRGEDASAAKLTAAQVRAIRAEYAAGGVLMREIAARLGVSDTTIKFVVNRKRWSHVD
jgi:hypothetical protein